MSGMDEGHGPVVCPQAFVRTLSTSDGDGTVVVPEAPYRGDWDISLSNIEYSSNLVFGDGSWVGVDLQYRT